MGIHTNHYPPVALAATAATVAATLAAAVAGKAAKDLGWFWPAKDLGLVGFQATAKDLGWVRSGVVGRGIISLGRARPQKI